MAEEHLSEDRNEEPTARRLQKAREDGEYARSAEVPAAGVMIAGTALIYFLANDLGAKLKALFASGFVFDRASANAGMQLPSIFMEQLAHGYHIILPLLLVTVLAAVIASGITGGYMFSMKSAAPNFGRVNPLSGIQRIFGTKALIELLKAVAKSTLVGGALWWTIAHDLQELLLLGSMAAEPAIAKAGELLVRAALAIATSLAAIALADALYQRYVFKQRMRMSKQEIRDEMKDTEGRPEVRAQIRRRQREMATTRMMQRIKDADVVITNPDHFAVALSYDPSKEGAPVLLAKGIDSLAFRIMEEANKTGVHVLRVPPLARALYFTTKVDHPIPEELYFAVAKIIAYVFSLNSFRPGMNHGAQPQVDVPSSMQFDLEGKITGTAQN